MEEISFSSNSKRKKKPSSSRVNRLVIESQRSKESELSNLSSSQRSQSRQSRSTKQKRVEKENSISKNEHKNSLPDIPQEEEQKGKKHKGKDDGLDGLLDIFGNKDNEKEKENIEQRNNKGENVAMNKILPILGDNPQDPEPNIPRKTVFRLDSFVDKLVGKNDDLYKRMLLEYDTFKNPPSLIAAKIHSVKKNYFFNFLESKYLRGKKGNPHK